MVAFAPMGSTVGVLLTSRTAEVFKLVWDLETVQKNEKPKNATLKTVVRIYGRCSY